MWEQEDKMVIPLTIHADTGEKYDNVLIDPSISIYDLKRLILNMKSKPFFLEENMKNDQTVMELLEQL